MTPRRALGILIGATALVRLAWAACLGAGNDEAYHYLFAVHPDWSYYDHPPMIAVVERLGLIASGGAPSVLALRAGFIALFAGATALMARLGRRVAGGDGWAGVLAAVILNATAYYGLAAGTFALPDGPLIFFWLLALDRLLAALERPERLGPWLLVGLAWGGAMLSKYHAVFLPAGAALFFLLEPDRRACLRRPGPYLAAAVGLGLFTPVIAWNAVHGWASFAFQSGRAMGSAVPRPDRLAAFLAGQAAYLLPWIWAALLAALWRRRGLLPGGPGDLAERFLLAQAVPPLAAVAAVACLRPVLPHWSLVGFLPLMPLAGRDWSALRASDPRRLRRRVATVLAVPVLGASLFVGQARWGWLQRGGRATLNLLAPAHDPTLDLYGWDQVADQLRRRGLTGRDGSFLFTSRWFLSGHLAFALGDGTPVLCYNPAGAHAFAHWSRPEQWVGRDGILVVVDSSPNEPQIYDRWFERIEPVGGFDVRRAGGTVRTVQLYRCVRQLRPFPFDGRELPPDPAAVRAELADRGRQRGRVR